MTKDGCKNRIQIAEILKIQKSGYFFKSCLVQVHKYSIPVLVIQEFWIEVRQTLLYKYINLSLLNSFVIYFSQFIWYLKYRI